MSNQTIPQTFIRSKLVGNLSRRERQECSCLTLGGGGIMQRKLEEEFFLQRVGTRPNPSPAEEESGVHPARAIMLRDRESGQLLAWAMLKHSLRDRTYATYFFVAPDQRRRGFGTQLYRHSHRFTRYVLVCPYNTVSRAFFSRLKAPACIGYR